MKIKAPQLIIFDCDGTLVDSEKITTKIIAGMINDLGIPISETECHDEFVGTKFQNIVDFLNSRGVRVDKTDMETRYRRICDVVFEKELEPIPGVVKLLEDLTTPYCIASNGPKEKMKVTLKHTGLSRFFSESHIFSAYDINKWKPEPDLFLLASNKLNVPPSSALVVEDTIHGIQAARSAGMQVIGVNIRTRKNDINDMGVPSFVNMEAVHDYFSNTLGLI
jgi:HAD superfamily hydrolase (TIGR01509 family)